MEEKERLRVCLLGGFKISRGNGRFITDMDSTSKRLWAFLGYISVFHRRLVSQEELIDALWGDVDSVNPANTLKTILHRARNAMEEHLGFADGKNVILYKRGAYSWSPDIELELDIEQFDKASNLPVEEDLGRTLETLKLYRGDFFPNASGSPWTVSLRTYYHTKYLKLCVDAATYLIKLGQFDRAEQICREASVIDPYNENCHLLLMKAMVSDGARQAAIQHYTYVKNMFMNQLGVSPSEEMINFYRELTKAEMGVEMDLNIVRRNLLEEEWRPGAYFCEYVTFQDIYRIRARDAERNGQVIQLAMITVLDRNGRQLDALRCTAALEELHSVIHRHLRAGDTYTRFSASQYLVLLPTASYENGLKILDRILDAYRRTLIGLTTTIRHSILPVLPTGEAISHAGFVPVK